MAGRIFKRVFGPSQISTTPATVFTSVAGQTTKITELIISQPAAGLAKTVRLSVGTDAAGTRSIEYPVPAGAGTWVLNPGLTVTGTETLQLSSTADNNIAIGTANGFTEIAA
jgi:hypothetical protein